MTRCVLQGADIHFTTSDGGERSKLDRYRSQISCPFSYKILGQRRKGWVADCCVAKCMGLAIPQDEPSTYRCDPWDYGIPTYLFSWMGVYGTPEAGRNRQIFSTTAVQHLANYIHGGEQTTGSTQHAAAVSCWLVTSMGQSPQCKIVWWSQVSMVHGNTWHNTYKCETVQNPGCGHRKLYTVRETGHHATSPNRMRGWKRDLGMDPQRESADTKNGPETDIHGLAASPLFQNPAPTTPPGNFVVFGAYGCLSGESTQHPVSTGIYWLHAADAMEDISVLE
jgi:hypothetical protein